MLVNSLRVLAKIVVVAAHLRSSSMVGALIGSVPHRCSLLLVHVYCAAEGLLTVSALLLLLVKFLLVAALAETDVDG